MLNRLKQHSPRYSRLFLFVMGITALIFASILILVDLGYSLGFGFLGVSGVVLLIIGVTFSILGAELVKGQQKQSSIP